MSNALETNTVYNYIDQNLNKFIARIQEFVRQPSISAENKGVQEAAKLLASYFEKIGCQNVEIVPTKGHPIVYAELNSKAKTTLLVYMMYDTQPVDDEKFWISPPFEANIVPLDLPSGKVSALVGRGSVNSKGPLVTFINAVEAIVNTIGKLPINLKFIAEGEEELGSPHLPDFVNEYKDKLKGAKATIFPSFLEDTWGKVKLSLGNKGIVYFELEASGKNWGKGPTEFDIHSSNKAWIDSPTWRLIDALSTMAKDNGRMITIDGFYDDVAEPSEEDNELLKELAKSFEPEKIKETIKVKEFIFDEKDKYNLLKKFLFSTTLNIDGIWSGYTGPGSKTVLPHKATCKVDVRLVPNQNDPNKIISLVRQHLDKHGYKDIEIRQLNGYKWSKTSVKHPVVQVAISSIRSFNKSIEIWPLTAGSAPMYLFNDVLEAPVVHLGLGHGARAHSPNEYIVIKGNKYVSGVGTAHKLFVKFLFDFGSW